MNRWIFNWLTSLAAGMPLWLGYGLARAFSVVHYAFFPNRRHAVLANLAVIQPGTSRRERARITREIMYNYNAFLFEFFRLPHLDRDDLLRRIQVEGKEHLDAAAAQGRGLVMVSSHIGNWELAGVILAWWGHHVYAVAGVQLSRWLTPAVRETKSEMAVTTVAPEDGFKKLYRAIENKGIVALLADGDIYSHPVIVDLFGRKTPMPAGPAVLGMRTGALVMTGYTVRLPGGRFRAIVEPALDPKDFANVADFSQAIAARLEAQVRNHIDQWCIFRSIWEPETTPQEATEAAARKVTA
jgi:KDO2-lipid IV(A) lauroyltransferase